MNYWLTEPAKNDLISIWEYTTDQWSEEQADRYIDALDARFAWLTTNEGLWKARSEIKKGLFSYPEQNHVILFWERHNEIEILRVLHGRMDLERHLVT